MPLLRESALVVLEWLSLADAAAVFNDRHETAVTRP